ncbi:hypothetical protein Dimus_034999 [Dionaea muscipula]
MARPREFDEAAALEAAVQRFWRYGYEATSVRDLAQDMGITGASLYNAFGDKRTLFQRALTYYVDNSFGERVSRLERDLSPRAAIEAFFAEIVDRSVRDAQRKGACSSTRRSKSRRTTRSSGRSLRKCWPGSRHSSGAASSKASAAARFPLRSRPTISRGSCSVCTSEYACSRARGRNAPCSKVRCGQHWRCCSPRPPDTARAARAVKRGTAQARASGSSTRSINASSGCGARSCAVGRASRDPVVAMSDDVLHVSGVAEREKQLAVMPVKLAAEVFAEHRERRLDGHRLAVRARAGHCVERVADADDRRRSRNLIACEAQRVAFAVRTFVVRVDGVDHAAAERVPRDETAADLRMRLDGLVLAVRQPVGLAQDRVRDRDLAQVVQESAHRHSRDVGCREARALREQTRVARYAPQMAACIGVARLHDPREAEQTVKRCVAEARRPMRARQDARQQIQEFHGQGWAQG